MKILVELFLQFLIIGATAFGGGYAILPLISNFVVNEKGWLSIGEMTDLVSISNMTPGPIAINSATFVGTKMKGIVGSIFATMGFVTPSLILMGFLGYLLFSSGKKITILDKMLKAIRPAIVGLIAIASIDMIKNAIFVDNISPESFTVNKVPLICFFVGLVLYWKKFDLIKLIILGGAMGIVLSYIF